LRRIIAVELESIVRDLAPVPNAMQGRFVYYHRDAAVDGRRSLDFGLTAELLSVLTVPAIRGLLNFSDEILRNLCDDLDAALLRGLSRYHDWPIFKFTHSVSLGQYLEVVGKNLISVDTIKRLDNQINTAIEGGVTENDLDILLERLCEMSSGIMRGITNFWSRVCETCS
jgi:hypothetical protein